MSLKLVLACLALLCLAALASASVVRPGSNEDLKEARLRNLAETIAELSQEAQAEEHQNAYDAEHTFVQLEATAEPAQNATKTTEPAQTQNATQSANSTSADHDSEPAERKTPQFQGTNRNDLVALWRFEDASNPGKGLGGAGRNLKVFGKGVSVVTGADAKRGKGSLRFEARPEGTGSDPQNPNQNSWLALDSSASPIVGLPKEDESFTLAAWYKVTARDAGSYGVLSFGGSESGTGNRLLATQSGRAVASFNDGSKLKSNNTADGEAKWHHAAVTFDRASHVQRVYVDGELRGQRKLKEAPTVASRGTFLLGVVNRSARSKQFVGLLDDVAVFRVVLNEEEIAQIKEGRFEPYLDLFALRGCRTRIGRRNHGATFVAGFEEEEISVNNNTLAYGFRAKNAFECSVRCAQTTNCRQSVFRASRRSASSNSTSSSKRRGGKCYLQSRKYATYEADPRSTSTVCNKPNELLQKKSFTLKLSADFDAQAARGIRRRARESKAKQEREDAAKEAERNAEAKRLAASRAATRTAEEQRAESDRAERRRKREAADKKERDEHKAHEDQEHDRADREAAEKREKKRRAEEVKARRAAKAEQRRRLEASIRERFEDKIAALKDRIKAKEAALSENKSQASHRALVETQRSSRIIAKLNARVNALQKKIANKEAETKTLALAASIKAAADQKSGEIVAAAKQRAIATRKEARLAHRRRLRERLSGKKAVKKVKKAKLTKKQRAARKAAKAMAAADAKKAAKAKRAARKAAKKAAKAKAAERRRKREAALARAADKKLAAKVSKPVASNPAQNGGMKF